MNRLWPWLLILLIPASLSSCQPPTSQPVFEPKWVYTDLRALDEADAEAADQDLLAGYLRLSGSELQIRLDFLDLNEVPATDLYLTLDSSPGGATELPWRAPVDLTWDTLIVIPAAGEIKVLASNLSQISGSGLRVVRDPVQDTITISLIADSLPGRGLPGRMQVFATASGSETIRDELGTFFTDGLPPRPAPVLLAFWDTLPAYTPALGLRRWDGAHTGPSGGRHGLYNLLRTARARQIPLALLDLKTPASLSALDYVGGLPMILEMEAQSELILPEVLPGFFPDQGGNPPVSLQAAGKDRSYFQALYRQVGTSFGLNASPFIYSQSGISPEMAGSGRVIFTFNPNLEASRLARWQGQLVIELPLALPPAAPASSGPDLDMRRKLIRGALNPGGQAGSGIVVLGGDLPASAWGNPEIARANFSYLVSHPWIRLLNAYDLLGMPLPATPARGVQPQPPNATAGWQQEIESAPDNVLGQAAWQAYDSLYAPVYPPHPGLPALREAYSGVVQVLLTAAHWAEDPTPIQDCFRDIDMDGQPECLLGSEQVLAVVQPESGELTFVFAIGSDGPHQLVGPGYQFISGLSEPETWEAGAGFDSDPGAEPGAFRDPVQAGMLPMTYSLQASINALDFKSSDGSVQKRYQLSGSSLEVTLELAQPNRYALPLALDPWQRFSPGWSLLYQATTSQDGWLWRLKNGPAVSVESNVHLQLNSILDSLTSTGQPEDPNQEHSEGHWLPFPMANLTIQGQNQIWVKIGLSEIVSSN